MFRRTPKNVNRISRKSLDQEENPAEDEEEEEPYKSGRKATAAQPRLLSFQNIDSADDNDEDNNENEEFKVKKALVPEDVRVEAFHKIDQPKLPESTITRHEAKLVENLKSKSATRSSQHDIQRTIETPRPAQVNESLDSVEKALASMQILEANKPNQQREKINQSIIGTRRSASVDKSSADEDWELNQISKGLTKLQLHQVSPLTRSRMISIDDDEVQLNPNQLQLEDLEIEAIMCGEAVKSLKPDRVLLCLCQKLGSLQEFVNITQRKLEASNLKLVQLQSETKAVEKGMRLISARFLRMQQRKAYIADLTDCLRYKIPKIKRIEKKMINLMEVHTKDLFDQRSENINTTYQQVKHALSLSDRPSEPGFLQPSKLTPTPTWGEDSNTEYKAQMEVLRQKAMNLFKDVKSEFATIDGVLKFFGNWKMQDPKLLKLSDAYNCITQMIAPYVWVETIAWDPLEADLNFEELSWCTALEGHKYLFDVKQKPEHIKYFADKILIPWVNQVVDAKFDPFSTSQNQVLLKAVQALQVVTEAMNMDVIRATLLSKFRKAVNNDVFLPVFPPDALKLEYAAAFASDQFWSSFKLFENMMLWVAILNDTELRTIALDGLLGRYLLLGIRASQNVGESLERAKRIARVIPRRWLGLANENAPASIELLISYLTSLKASGSKEEDIYLNQSISEILNILQKY